jgi:hypothetical protein
MRLAPPAIVLLGVREHVVLGESNLEPVDEARLADARCALDYGPRTRAADDLSTEQLDLLVTADEERDRPRGVRVRIGLE